MKIIKKLSNMIKETEITICASNKEEIEKIALAIAGLNTSILCHDEDMIRKVNWCDILYFESVDRKTFVYTKTNMYTISKRLYEIEKDMPHDFIRCSKSTILNLSRIKCFATSLESRLKAIMINDEVVMVNRQYVKNIKNKINGGN